MSATSARTRLSRPDRTEFDKELNALKARLAKHQSVIQSAREAMNAFKTGKGQDPEWDNLQSELSAAKTERQTEQDKISGVQGEIRTLDQEIQRKIKEIQARLPKSGARSEAEFSAKITQLEKLVDSGDLPLVEERKTIKEITALKNGRRQFEGTAKIQAEVDALRAKIAEIRKGVDETPVKNAQAKVAEIRKKLDARKAERDSIRKQRGDQWTVIRGAQTEAESVRNEMDTLRKDFNTKLTTFKKQVKEQQKEREEEEKKAKEESQRAKKLADAKSKVDAAKVPAYTGELTKAHSLLAFFDPSHKHETNGAASTTTPTNLGTTRATRSVEALPDNAKVLSRQDANVAPSRKEQRRRQNAGPKSDKLRLDVGVISDLSSLGIPLPVSSEDVSNTKAKLLEKIKYFEENSAQATEKRVAQAEAELAKLEKAHAEEPVSEAIKDEEPNGADAEKTAAEKIAAEKTAAEKTAAEKTAEASE